MAKVDLNNLGEAWKKIDPTYKPPETQKITRETRPSQDKSLIRLASGEIKRISQAENHSFPKTILKLNPETQEDLFEKLNGTKAKLTITPKSDFLLSSDLIKQETGHDAVSLSQPHYYFPIDDHKINRAEERAWSSNKPQSLEAKLKFTDMMLYGNRVREPKFFSI